MIINKQIIDLNESLEEIKQSLPGLSEEVQKVYKNTEKTPVFTDDIQNVMRIKSKQFNFSSGVAMAKIDQNINTRFGLKYHFLNSNDFSTFLESVKKTIEIGDNIKLSPSDIKKLEKQYNYGVNLYK